MRSCRPLTLGFASALAFSFVACSDDTASKDGGVRPDADPILDALVLTDAAPIDSGFGVRDSGADAGGRADGGHYCVQNERVSVNMTPVVLAGSTTSEPSNPMGTASELSCFAERPTILLNARVRFRGCARVLGAKPTQSELDQLEIAVFRATDAQGRAVDPTYNPETGVDRTPTARIAAMTTVIANSTGCNGGVEIEIGREATGADSVTSDFEYIIRIRNRPGSTLWAETYDQGVIVRTDNLERGGGNPDRCTPQTCSARVDLVLARQAALTAAAATLRVTDPASKGHALALVTDCTNVGIAHAIGGFSPAATQDYVDARLNLGGAATQTSTIGGLLGLGFTNTSSRAPGAIAVGFGVNRDGTCTEGYAGRTARVYPGALSVVRVGLENTLNRGR